MYDIILSFITAFTLTYFAIPSVINIARVKRLFDDPNERSSHTVSIPSLGGIAIFAGLLFSVIFWTPFADFGNLQYILCALLIIFLIGAKDDILPMRPSTKFAGQIFAALIMVYKAKVEITSFYGLFGINELETWFSFPFTIVIIVLVINAFNLIDGINGLAGTIGSIIAATFGIWFFLIDKMEIGIICFSLLGAIVAFLKYNYSPAKIFMGDTGSLLIGLVSSMLAIKFLELNMDVLKDEELSHYYINAAPAVVIGVLIIPLYDTIRVFTTRILKGRSPFYPDKTHIHHLLLDLGFSHMQGTIILAITNIFFIVLVFLLQGLGTLLLMIIVLGLATILSAGLYYTVKKRKQNLNKAVG